MKGNIRQPRLWFQCGASSCAGDGAIKNVAMIQGPCAAACCCHWHGLRSDYRYPNIVTCRTERISALFYSLPLFASLLVSSLSLSIIFSTCLVVCPAVRQVEASIFRVLLVRMTVVWVLGHGVVVLGSAKAARSWLVSLLCWPEQERREAESAEGRERLGSTLSSKGKWAAAMCVNLLSLLRPIMSTVAAKWQHVWSLAGLRF